MDAIDVEGVGSSSVNWWCIGALVPVVQWCSGAGTLRNSAQRVLLALESQRDTTQRTAAQRVQRSSAAREVGGNRPTTTAQF